jgi:FtsH ternary system-associated peptide
VSRAIQIRVSESVVRTVHVEDGVQSPLEMLPILAPERMGDLLAAELERQGFVREGQTMKRSDKDGIEITVDLETATVTAKIGASADLEESIDRRANVGIERREQAEESLRRDVQRDLEDRIASRTEALRREVTDKLEKKLADLRNELDGAVGRATVSALQEKAAQLGHIESVVEEGGGNVTIKVKL